MILLTIFKNKKLSDNKDKEVLKAIHTPNNMLKAPGSDPKNQNK